MTTVVAIVVVRVAVGVRVVIVVVVVALAVELCHDDNGSRCGDDIMATIVAKVVVVVDTGGVSGCTSVIYTGGIGVSGDNGRGRTDMSGWLWR